MMGQQPSPEWLETDWRLQQFSRTKKRAREAFENFVRAGIGLPGVWDGLRGQIYLGSEQFILNLQTELTSQLDDREIPRMHRRPVALPLFDYASQHPERDAAMRAAFVSGDYTQQQIAVHFGVHYSTVSRAVKRGRS